MRIMKQPTRRLASGVVALAFAFATMTANAPTANAAGGVGNPYQADVVCDSLGNYLKLTAAAAATPGVNSQTIAYRYAIWDHSRNQQVLGWWPSNWGYFTHTRVNSNGSVTWTNPSATSGETFLPGYPDGNYSVQTQYGFLNGSTWSYTGWVTTQSYRAYGAGYRSLCEL